MVQAAVQTTGADPGALVAAAVHHSGQGGRPRLLENGVHGVTRVLHWRVRDRAGAEVDAAYERLRGASLPDVVSPMPAGEVGRLDGGGLVGAGQLVLAGMPAPGAPAPEPLVRVVSGAAVPKR